MVALVLDERSLAARIDGLRSGYAGYANTLLSRHRDYLRAFSPEYNADLHEHDQWVEPILTEDAGHTRSSFNIVRAAVELWASLEASEMPALRWQEGFVPTPAPSLDETENEQRQTMYRALKTVRRQLATMREQTVLDHARRAKLGRHLYNAILRKNIYGHSWLKTVPDVGRSRFNVFTRIDPSVVYPIWSAWDDSKLDAILVAYRKSAAQAAATWPELVQVDRAGLVGSGAYFYTPTPSISSDADRNWVWVEDYWVLDAEYEREVDHDDPVRSRVVNCFRVNGQIPSGGIIEYPGWTRVPYFQFENPNGRDRTGFSDVGTLLPFQDGMNRFLSQQQDVIFGESRPKFKYRGDSERQITVSDEGIISLDPDEDIEQIAVHLDVFPTQVHGQQLTALLSRATGLPAVTWGEIQAAQNSGRALSTAWRATAARMVPRTMRNSQTVEEILSFWVDCMELYNWDDARDLFAGNRDFELEWPNQEPRDFQEVTLDAINRYNIGAIDVIKLMELTGETSPDEMDERVRAEYMDPVRHPDKAQAFYLLQQYKQNLALQALQAGMQMGQAQQAQQQGQVQDAQNKAAAQATPALGQNQNAPPTAPGGQNAGARYSTMVQDGRTFNRIVNQGPVP